MKEMRISQHGRVYQKWLCRKFNKRRKLLMIHLDFKNNREGSTFLINKLILLKRLNYNKVFHFFFLYNLQWYVLHLIKMRVIEYGNYQWFKKYLPKI